MATLKINRKPKVSVIPTETDRANVAEFDQVAKSLGLISRDIRPRRWLLRIGALLHKMRGSSDLKQEQLAKIAGVTQAYLSRLENGLIPKRGPTVEVLLRCADAAQCDLEIAVRSRKDGELLGMVSSRDLEESLPLHSDSEGTAVAAKVEAEEVVKVILEPQDTELRSKKAASAASAEPDYVRIIEQARASLEILLKKYNASVSSRSTGRGVVELKSLDLGPASGQAATDLVQALEVVWPYRRKRGLTTVTGHGVQRTKTVKVGAGHLVIIGGADPGAAIDSVGISGTGEGAKSAESES